MSANGSIYTFTDQTGQRVFVKDTSLNFRGAWNGGASYVYKDVSDYGSDQYIALVPSTGIAPPTDISRSAYWSGLVLYQQGTAVEPEFASSFLDLTDAPAAYGAPGDKLVVAQNGTTLAFAGPDSLLSLSDTPNAYGQPGQSLVVASNGTTLTFASPATPAYFRAFNSFGFIASGLNIFPFWTTNESNGIAPNPSTGLFTCVVPGVYRFDGSAVVKVLNASTYEGGLVELTLRVNGTNPVGFAQYGVIGADTETTTLYASALVSLSAGQTVGLYTNVDFVPNVNTDLVSYERRFSSFKL